MGATATIAAEVLATVAVNKALAPDPPEIKPPTPMPDPLETQRAKERSLVEQLGRRGRANSILTNAGGSQTLGGG